MRRRRTLVDRDGVEAGDHGVGREAGDDRRERRDGDAPDDLAVDEDAADDLGLMGSGRDDELHRRELGGLILQHAARGDVADHDLDRRGERRDHERDREPEAHVPIRAAAQQSDRIDRREQEARHHVGGQEHVRDLVPGRGVEDDPDRIDRDDLARGVDLEAGRLVHPAVRRDHGERAADPRQCDRDPRQEMEPGREPSPAVDVDRDEDRLEEEEQAFDRERDPEGTAVAAHEARPEQAHLEGQDRPGHRAYGEGHGHHGRPSTSEQERRRIAAPKADGVRDQDDGRQPDAQARQHDVEAEGERHLGSGGQQLRRHRWIHVRSLVSPTGEDRQRSAPRPLSAGWMRATAMMKKASVARSNQVKGGGGRDRSVPAPRWATRGRRRRTHPTSLWVGPVSR